MRVFTYISKLTLALSIIAGNIPLWGQEVAVQSYSVNGTGQVQLEVHSSADMYYVLEVRHHPDSAFNNPVSLTLGQQNSTIISEPLGHYPLSHYRVLEYPIEEPGDVDGDEIDDITEFLDSPNMGPFSGAAPLSPEDGLVMVDSFESFQLLSEKNEIVQWSEFLNGKEYVKFIISDFDSNPKVYFINTENHNLHADFAAAIGIEYIGENIKKGQISYHPTYLSNGGQFGTFAFNYSNGHGRDFEVVQRTMEILAANMPFLQNNLSYYITDNNEAQYNDEIEFYENSRISVIFESDLYANIDYWGLNLAEGYGLFRHLTLEDIPGPKDIVLYDALPNNLPRVAGIMTSVIQTPLSHVNLRAIQNNIPNAFVRDPLLNDSIANLIDKYVYYKVEQGSFELREATIEEVNQWFEDIRPDEDQFPPLNLEHTEILPLDEIAFEMYDGFGAKTANMATMRSFGFDDQAIPNGFGIPFYFYQEFMAFNQFFIYAEDMMNASEFIEDRDARDAALEEFRDLIKSADMPLWMLEELAMMHNSFEQGTSVRCRSSSNNEDLPGFNGAGLYTSKTQHPTEGHIAKSIKQVYASLWNLRAFEERDFYRVDHFTSSMGVLCHPNFVDEKANGVGVSTDPIFNTEHTFYLNTQLGDDLITNPQSNSIPEEILLEVDPDGDNGVIVIQNSNLVMHDSLLLSDLHLEQMRTYLSVIHHEFEKLYEAEGNETFAMDIEYKITHDNHLVIKQARPWVSYVPKIDEELFVGDSLNLLLFPNPTSDILQVQCKDCQLTQIAIYNINGQKVYHRLLSTDKENSTVVPVRSFPNGMYLLHVISQSNSLMQSKMFIKEEY